MLIEPENEYQITDLAVVDTPTFSIIPLSLVYTNRFLLRGNASIKFL